MEVLSKLAGALLISTFMLQIGLALAPRALREQVRHVGTLLRGVFFFLVVTPLTAWFVTWAFRLNPPSAVAMILLSCAGVAPLAARSARKARADVALAIVLTFALGVLTFATAPPTAKWLLGYRGEIPFDARTLIPQLALLEVAPLLLGIVIQNKTSHGPSFERVVSRINTVAFVAVAALIVGPRLGNLAALGWRGAIATVVLAVLVAIGGYFVGGPSRSAGRTLAAIANVPNVGLALGIVASVGARPVFSVTIVGAFLLRLIVGVFVKKVIARRPELDERPTPRLGERILLDHERRLRP